MRTFLDGRFENSAFCLLAPNGKDWLTKAGRGPQMVIGRSTSSSIARMDGVAKRFPETAGVSKAIVPDFHSVRQALNVASADQRVLVLVHGNEDELNPLRESLREIANDKDIVGRFHFDFETSKDWKKIVPSATDGSGIYLIRSGEFGMDGEVMTQRPLTTSNEQIRQALLAANSEYARTTEKKVYSDHVSKGQNLGIYFEGAVPYGEDRDGDGQIDRQNRGGNHNGNSRRSRQGVRSRNRGGSPR